MEGGPVTAERRGEGQLQWLTPAAKRYVPIDDRADLLQHLQWALGVELATIPPYLSALYSIVDEAAEAAALIRSVVVEEMLHMAQVSNLMNAIGGCPSLKAGDVPYYPTFIPHHAAGGPFIQVGPLTAEVARTVFMAIEQPEASIHSPAEGDDFHTIGQFYKAIEEGFHECARRDPDLFSQDTGFQRADTYFGAGGGELIVVHTMDDVTTAIQEITEQGEGAIFPYPPQPGQERFGDYDNWGLRTDGTYGPIIGVPWELSHYEKFKEIADGVVSLPPTHPAQPNPSTEALPAPLRPLSELFDGCYTMLLGALEQSFTSKETDRQFFGIAFPLMQSALPQLARVLMRTPLHPEADPLVGPTAGPAFRYRTSTVDELIEIATELLERPPSFGSDYRDAWTLALQAVIRGLQGEPRKVALAPDKPAHGAHW
jgi:hypothetical protein